MMERFIDNILSKIKKKHYPFLSFFFTFVLLLLLFSYAGIMPGGTKSILVSDLYGQYYDFLIGYRNLIWEGKSFIHSWNIGMGLNIVGWFAYYTASPLNLILLLFPENGILYGVTFLIILKLSLSSMSLCVYLKKTLKQEGAEVILFSCLYAMSGYAITYYFSVMWLDAFILLPFLLLQVNKLVETKKSRGLIGVLTILFFSNYYMAYMVGVFSFFYFCAYYKYKNQKIFMAGFLNMFLRFVGSALVAACMNGAILIPTFLQMMGLQEGTQREAVGILPQLDFLSLYNNLFMSSYTTVEAGKPLIYTGILSLLILPLYFLNHKIAKKERFLMGGLLLLLGIIMCIPFLDLLMHAGMEPTWFLYRYSFFVSFLFAVIGCRQFPFLMNEKMKKVVIVIAANIGILLISNLIIDRNIPKILFNLVFIAGYGLVFYGAKLKKIRKKDIYAMLFFLCAFELILNGYTILGEIDQEVGYRDTVEIKEEKGLTREALEQNDSKEEPNFYRMEKNYTATLNDSMGEGYQGIANFSSVYHKQLNEYLYSLGIWVHYWQVKYCGSTELTNTVLNVKEVLHSRKKELFSFSSKKEEETFYVEENACYLPVGFMVDEGLERVNFPYDRSTNAVRNQQMLWKGMLGREAAADCFVEIEPNRIELENVKVTMERGKRVYHKIEKEREAYITYHITKEKERASYYFYFQYDNSDSKQKLLITTDNMQKLHSDFIEIQTCQVPFNLSLTGDNMVGQGEEVKIKIDFLEEETFAVEDELFYYIDQDKFQEGYDELKKHTLQVTEYGDTSLKGTIEVSDKTLLYTSIPYDKGWTAKVDGVKTQCIPLFDGALIGLSLAEGNHQVEFYFCPEGLKVGIVLTFLGFVIFSRIWLIDKGKKA